MRVGPPRDFDTPPILGRRHLAQPQLDFVREGLGAQTVDAGIETNLVERRKITPQLKDWADQARIGGRIAAHGSGGNEWGDPDKLWGDLEDASIVIDYLKGFFDYVYVLNARMKQRMDSHKSLASQSGTDSNEE